MRILLSLSLLSALFLVSCGSNSSQNDSGSLGGMFGTDSSEVETRDDSNDVELPVSEGPSTLPVEQPSNE